MGLREILRRRRFRKAFRGYLSPETIEKLVRETKPEDRPAEVKHFQFVVILVDDTKPEEVPAIISTVMGALVQQHATVLNITSSLVVAALGVPFPEGNSAEGRRGLVEALLRDNGERIRIVHGECDGAWGNFGGHGRWSYGGVIPGFSEILKKLLETKFGTAVDIS